MNILSSEDWLGIASILLLLIVSVVDNAYLLFGVYGLTLTSGALIIFRKSGNKVGAIIIVIASIIGIMLNLIQLARS